VAAIDLQANLDTLACLSDEGTNYQAAQRSKRVQDDRSKIHLDPLSGQSSRRGEVVSDRTVGFVRRCWVSTWARQLNLYEDDPDDDGNPVPAGWSIPKWGRKWISRR
jgi:hypothetical protein